jgi:hypothetical protein
MPLKALAPNMGTRGKPIVEEADSWHGNYAKERESHIASQWGEPEISWPISPSMINEKGVRAIEEPNVRTARTFRPFMNRA